MYCTYSTSFLFTAIGVDTVNRLEKSRTFNVRSEGIGRNPTVVSKSACIANPEQKEPDDSHSKRSVFQTKNYTPAYTRLRRKGQVISRRMWSPMILAREHSHRAILTRLGLLNNRASTHRSMSQDIDNRNTNENN